jgi:hypothetical protein
LAVELELMPVVLLVFAELLSFVFVLPFVADWPVTLLVSPAADATPVASASAGTNSAASSLDLKVFIVLSPVFVVLSANPAG